MPKSLKVLPFWSHSWPHLTNTQWAWEFYHVRNHGSQPHGFCVWETTESTQLPLAITCNYPLSEKDFPLRLIVAVFDQSCLYS